MKESKLLGGGNVDSVTVNLDGHLDWIWSQVKGKLLGTPVRDFLDQEDPLRIVLGGHLYKRETEDWKLGFWPVCLGFLISVYPVPATKEFL